MMIVRKIFLFVAVMTFLIGCSVFNKPKEGCPSNGKNIGAERLLSSEKVPKAKKFRN